MSALALQEKEKKKKYQHQPQQMKPISLFQEHTYKQSAIIE
jgi:hypothetical protein